jgi:hypothetical protein
MNQRWENLCRTARKGIYSILAFFPVVASSTNLSTSIRLQNYEK